MRIVCGFLKKNVSTPLPNVTQNGYNHQVMQLREYLKQYHLGAAQFARMLGVKSRMTVYRYLRGERIPSAEMMKKIVALTDGLVQPNDFFTVDQPITRSYRQMMESDLVRVEKRIGILGSVCGAAGVQIGYGPDQIESGWTDFDQRLDDLGVPESLQMAVKILMPDLQIINSEKFRYRGRVLNPKDLVLCANRHLMEKGQSLIPYPGVCSLPERAMPSLR